MVLVVYSQLRAAQTLQAILSHAAISRASQHAIIRSQRVLHDHQDDHMHGHAVRKGHESRTKVGERAPSYLFYS